MKSALFKTSFFVFICVCGFSWGYFSPNKKINKLEMSSQDPSSTNSFDVLPCPTEQEYAELAARVSLKIPDGPAVCDSSYRAKIGKALLYMTRLKMNPPATWLSDVQPDFADLLSFVAKNSRHMDLDLDQAGSIAYNNTVEQKIYIGAYFFGMDPLSAISTLIHEARHSVKTASGHVQCEGGDIPRSQGGCDQAFEITAKDAGAYSYEVLWMSGLGLYGLNIPEADREFLKSSALTTLATRFNEIPAELAKKADVLMALNKQGDLLIVDPVTKKFSPVKIKFPFAEEKISRIEFSFRTSGVMIFTNQGHLYSWTFRSGLQFYNDGVIPASMPIHDASRIMLPGSNNRTTFTVQTDNNTYMMASLPQGRTKMEMVKILSDEDMKKAPQFRRYFLAQYGDSIFLTEAGELYMLTHEIVADPMFKKAEGLQDPQGWQQGTGGVIYEDLILLNKSGALKIAESHYQEIDDNTSITTYTMKEKDFRIPGRGVKYFQGLKYEAQMNDRGDMYLRKYGTTEQLEVKGNEIVDFTIIHNPVLGRSVVPR